MKLKDPYKGKRTLKQVVRDEWDEFVKDSWRKKGLKIIGVLATVGAVGGAGYIGGNSLWNKLKGTEKDLEIKTTQYKEEKKSKKKQAEEFVAEKKKQAEEFAIEKGGDKKTIDNLKNREKRWGGLVNDLDKQNQEYAKKIVAAEVNPLKGDYNKEIEKEMDKCIYNYAITTLGGEMRIDIDVENTGEIVEPSIENFKNRNYVELLALTFEKHINDKKFNEGHVSQVLTGKGKIGYSGKINGMGKFTNDIKIWGIDSEPNGLLYRDIQKIRH